MGNNLYGCLEICVEVVQKLISSSVYAATKKNVYLVSVIKFCSQQNLHNYKASLSTGITCSSIFNYKPTH